MIRPVMIRPVEVDEAEDIDMRVGERIKYKRLLLGISQTEVAKSLGISFQQLQKYEKGINRISAGKLYHLSKILGEPVTYFFENPSNNSSKRSQALPKDHTIREAAEVINSFYAIKNLKLRQQIKALLKAAG